MTYKTTKRFDKEYAKLSVKKQNAVDNALQLFMHEPNHPSLRVHSLVAEWKGHKSISAGGDLRIHFIELLDELIIVFVAVGSHSQLYK